MVMWESENTCSFCFALILEWIRHHFLSQFIEQIWFHYQANNIIHQAIEIKAQMALAIKEYKEDFYHFCVLFIYCWNIEQCTHFTIWDMFVYTCNTPSIYYHISIGYLFMCKWAILSFYLFNVGTSLVILMLIWNLAKWGHD